MTQPNSVLKNKLANFTELVDSALQNEKDNVSELNLLEDWLKIHIEKIRFSRLKKSELVPLENKTQSQQKDAILVFDDQLKIHYYSGFISYFFNESLIRSNNITFHDIIEDLNTTKLKSFLESDKKENEFELNIKSNAGPPVKCFLWVDDRLSNYDQKLFVGNLVFRESVIRNLSDYQSLMLDNLPGMDIYLIDKNYRFIVSGGKEKEKYHRYNKDYVGKTLFEVTDKKTQRSLYPFFSKALNGESTEGEIRYKKDIYYISATPVKDHESNTLAGIIFLQNITYDKLLSQQLENAKEEAQKANKAKSIFIANVSHEIRTPLNTIIGFTEQLQKTPLSETQLKYVSLINSASDHLLNLVTEVVFLFKLGLGKVFIEKSPFSLVSLLDELNELFTSQANEKNLVFHIYYDDAIPETAIGDSFRLKQILMNLLVNAIKYTDKGQITLSCNIVKQTRQKVECAFKVTDTGIGIKEADLPFIFDVFEQGNLKSENIRGGAGLGLGICQKLVDLLGGRISVKSKVDEGTTFEVTLPFEKTILKKRKEKEIKFNLDAYNLQGKRVLIADDDEYNQMLSALILENFKTNYTLVTNGSEALQELQQNKYDLILLDIHMPKLSGTEVIRKIRSNNTNLNFKTPALSVTANALKSDIHNYLKSGFDDYLIKPFKEQELYNKLCNLLSIEPNIMEEKEKTDNNKQMKNVDEFNATELLNTSNGDMDFFNSMIENFISNSENLMNSFELLVKNKSWDDIGEKAHKAIPSFKYFELNKTSDDLRQIETLALREKKYHALPELVKEVSQKIARIVDTAKTTKSKYTAHE